MMETIDKLYLELSLISTAVSGREQRYKTEIKRALDALLDKDERLAGHILRALLDSNR